MVKKRKANIENDMIYCYRCNATYSGNIHWAYGYDAANGTEGMNFVQIGTVQEGHCPMCRKLPLLEEPKRVWGI